MNGMILSASVEITTEGGETPLITRFNGFMPFTQLILCISSTVVIVVNEYCFSKHTIVGEGISVPPYTASYSTHSTCAQGRG